LEYLHRFFRLKRNQSAAFLWLLLAFLLLAGCSSAAPAPSQSSEPTPAGTLPTMPPESYGSNRAAANLSYLQAEAERVLTEQTVEMIIYPEDDTVIREIPEGTLLTVLAAAASEKQEWLLVRIRDLRSPSNIIGWVEQGKTLAYDDSMKDQLASPVLLPAGTVVYPSSDDGKILWDSAQTQNTDAFGTVLRREDDYLLLALTGGEEVWAASDTVQAGNP
jgi:hypothetical protein